MSAVPKKQRGMYPNACCGRGSWPDAMHILMRRCNDGNVIHGLCQMWTDPRRTYTTPYFLGLSGPKDHLAASTRYYTCFQGTRLSPLSSILVRCDKNPRSSQGRCHVPEISPPLSLNLYARFLNCYNPGLLISRRWPTRRTHMS